MSNLNRVLFCALALSVGACGDDDGGRMDVSPDSPVDVPADADNGTLTIDFEAVVGSEAFSCGTQYTGLGMGETGSWTGDDLRFYVHNFEVGVGDGNYVAAELVDDGMWQGSGVALLDFENGCGDMGTNETNTRVVLQLPPNTTPNGDVRFSVGVPESLNHQNASTASTPLNLTTMFWNWNGGYKFMRIEGPTMTTDGMEYAAWRLHLGSTMCTGDMMGDATCANGNRPVIEVPGAGTTVRVDIAALLAGSTLGNTDETPPGCMSAPTDPDCASIFAALGLPFGDAPGGNQTVFTAAN